ncbi:MAG: hypothetical protein J6T19_05315 [Paludibacteraceae bacterium]|nr:hypothetical protein [Paludibacteraceae bacterium]
MKKLKRLEKTYYYKVLRALVCVCACAIYTLGLSGCNNELESVPVELELRMAISASGISNSQGAPSVLRNEESDTMQLRAFGDPGETESFELPDHLYAYLVWSEGGDPEVTHVQVIKTELNPGSWVQEKNSLSYQTEGDPIYVYTQKIFTLLKDKKRVWGKLYVFVSKGEVSLYVKDNPSKAEADFTEADVLNLVFNNNTSTIQDNLKNFYSTPHNYEVNDKYYGTIANFAYDGTGESESGSRVAYANLLLYHVAAKVDLMWNVKEDMRSTVKVSYIAAEHLYDGPCYVFKPMENAPDVSGTDGKYTSGYSKEIISNLSVGTQWNGRKYFYTIPYKNSSNKFPLQVKMLKNEDVPKKSDDPETYRTDAEYYHLIQNTDMSAGAIFLPWIRCQMKINKELEYSATPDVFPKLAP